MELTPYLKIATITMITGGKKRSNKVYNFNHKHNIQRHMHTSIWFWHPHTLNKRNSCVIFKRPIFGIKVHTPQITISTWNPLYHSMQLTIKRVTLTIIHIAFHTLLFLISSQTRTIKKHYAFIHTVSC